MKQQVVKTFIEVINNSNNQKAKKLIDKNVVYIEKYADVMIIMSKLQ